MTMTLHNYRSRQFHRTSNGINPSSGFRDMGSAKSGPSAAWFDKFLAHGQAHMGQIRASYRYSIYRKYRYQHIDTITGIPIGAFSIRIDIILTVVLWSRLHQGWSSTELFTKDINRHFLHLIRKAAYRLRLRCVNWQSKQTGPLSLPARDCRHQEGPVYKASLVAVIVIAVPLVDVAAGMITLPMDSHACQEFYAVANFRWVLHKRSSFVVVLTWFTYGYSCPSMQTCSYPVKWRIMPYHGIEGEVVSMASVRDCEVLCQKRKFVKMLASEWGRVFKSRNGHD